MALDAEQLAARNEATAWLRNQNMDRDGYTVAARLEAAFPEEDPAPAPELEASGDTVTRDRGGRFA